MTKNNGFKVAALAASIALAMAATSAMAADPAANALPGQGKVAAGTIDAATSVVSTDGKTLTIALTGGPAVINWGSGTDINKTGTAGFNIGSAETVTFTGAFPVLNIDSSGNASQIFGALGAAGNVYVANSNGIIVGSGGSITSTGEVGLLGNTTFGTNAGFTGTAASATFNGGGGDVTVQPGASLNGGTVFISGGGNVNVDLGALAGGAATISAGVSQGAVPATPNANANVAITGTLGAGSIAAIGSAGTASNAGVLDLTGVTQSVKGAFTNTGDLTLDATNGTVINEGKLTTASAATFDSLTNAGSYGAAGITINSGGSLTNTGEITGAGVVVVNEGNINNSGSIADVTSLTTQSDSGNDGFAAGGQYFVNNTGTITSTGALQISANATHLETTGTNDSTGSFTNTGTLEVGGAASNLIINANNNVSLGGTLKAGATPKALSATNTLGNVSLTADNGANGTGTVSVMTPVFFGANTATLSGAQVKLMANVTGGTSTAPAGSLVITAGDAPTGDYSVRVANGTTASAGFVSVDSATDTSASTILQGTLTGNDIEFGVGNAVSDVFSGPNGGINAVGTTPYVEFDFTGGLKTAKYNNNANGNFRYNYLPISAPDDTLTLYLNPTKYLTNGTSNGKSAVNILVNGDVDLDLGALSGGIDGTGSAVTGVTNIPNTHLVLQSTGDISTAGYWPGYVYLGTIDSDTDGNALPGTLSDDGKITLTGAFNNVLPGDVAGASGIHFMSGNALVSTSTVTTNANAWINFPTDLLTQGYAQGLLTQPTFSGGTATGLIVNYAPYTVGQTEKLFNTHPVDSTK